MFSHAFDVVDFLKDSGDWEVLESNMCDGYLVLRQIPPSTGHVIVIADWDVMGAPFVFDLRDEYGNTVYRAGTTISRLSEEIGLEQTMHLVMDDIRSFV